MTKQDERREEGRRLTVRAEIKAYSIKWEIAPSLTRTFASLRRAEELAKAMKGTK